MPRAPTNPWFSRACTTLWNAQQVRRVPAQHPAVAEDALEVVVVPNQTQDRGDPGRIGGHADRGEPDEKDADAQTIQHPGASLHRRRVTARRACNYAHVRQCNDTLTHWRSDVEIHQREHQATRRLQLRPMEQRDLDFITERPVMLSMIGGTRSGGDNHARGCVNALMHTCTLIRLYTGV